MRIQSRTRRDGKRATNVSMSDALVQQAKQLGVNISQACERGLTEEVARVRRERWLEENREAIEAYNERVEREGLPLAAYRQF